MKYDVPAGGITLKKHQLLFSKYFERTVIENALCPNVNM